MRPDGRYKSLGTWRTKTEAEQALVYAESEQLKGEWQATPDNPGTVAEWAERWLAHVQTTVRPSTMRGYRSVVTIILSSCRIENYIPLPVQNCSLGHKT
jgi:hypothetical protein